MKKNKTIMLLVYMLTMALYAGAQQSASSGNTTTGSLTRAQPEVKNQVQRQNVHSTEIQATDASLIYEAQHKQGHVKSNSSLPSKTSSKKVSDLQPKKGSQSKK